MIGKIKRVALRKVWKHEASEFTPWILENIDVINDTLDLNLSNPEREQAAGTFSADIVAEDENGNPVIIENQLEKSDHNHLGKIITYLTSVDAKIAIWIVADPRPEHIGAISWLNESSSASFYLVKVEAIQIEDSPPAPLLTLIVGPSDEARAIGVTKKEYAERHNLRHSWWEQLLEHAKTKTKLHANITPGKYAWLGTGSGVRGISYNYYVTQNETAVELYIDRGKEAREENKLIFDKLFKNKDEIEAQFGGKLEWMRLETKLACRIKKNMSGGYKSPEEEWGKIHEEAVDTMISFHKAINPYIKKLDI